MYVNEGGTFIKAFRAPLLFSRFFQIFCYSIIFIISYPVSAVEKQKKQINKSPRRGGVKCFAYHKAAQPNNDYEKKKKKKQRGAGEMAVCQWELSYGSYTNTTEPSNLFFF